jgi:hypothetical protein
MGKKWTGARQGGKVMVTFTYHCRICTAVPHLADDEEICWTQK